MAARLTRRSICRAVLASIAAGAGGFALYRPAHAERPPRRFVFVIGAFGGASIIDSFLAMSEADVAMAGGDAGTFNAYGDSEHVKVAGTPFSAIDRTSTLFGSTFPSAQSTFVQRHHAYMQVVTQTGTSVNHTIGQKRSLTGNGAWNGRTVQEAVAAQYGEGSPLPNVNMGSLGFLADGDDHDLPLWARAEPVADPRLWPLSLDGITAVENAPDRELVELARTLRNEQLDPESLFWQSFQLGEKLQRWKTQRATQLPVLEDAELLGRLNFALSYPGLPEVDAATRIALDAAFGHLTFDPLEVQAAMAFLLVRHGLSVAVTLSPSWSLVANPNAGMPGEPVVVNPPLSFDYSHNSHRDAQAIMWQRILGVTDALIGLLQQAEHPDLPGASLWDHSLVYIATDFGRTKKRPPFASSFGSGHDLNNGVVLLSPLVRGNTVLGGVDPLTLRTFGYDTTSGAPTPGVELGERFLYAGMLQALGVDSTGSDLPVVPAMLP